MITVNWFHLCDHITIGQDEKISLIGIFDQGLKPAHGYPFTVHRFFAVADFEITAGTNGNLEVSITDPKGQTLAVYPIGPITTIVEPGVNPAQARSRRLGLPAEFTNIIFQEPGNYRIKILFNGNKVHTHILELE